MDFTLDSWYQDQKRLEELSNPAALAWKEREAQMAEEDKAAKYKALQTEPTGNPDQIFKPRTDEDYDKIPMGSIYIDPDDGKLYRKTKERKNKTDQMYRYNWS